MTTCVAIVSRLNGKEANCIVNRTKSFSFYFVTYLLSTLKTNFSTYIPPAKVGMHGLYGSSAGSRDSKKRFVMWAANQVLCDYIWHFEDDTIVANPKEMLSYSNSVSDLISSYSSLNEYYMKYCVFCRTLKIQKQIAWPALRISRKFAIQLYNLSFYKHGHHEPLTQAACQYLNCTQEELKNTSIKLLKNKHEHNRYRERNMNAMFVHPNKC